MKIVLISQNYHPFVGGIETHVRQIAHEMSHRHSVAVGAVNFTPNRLPGGFGVLHGSLLAPQFESFDDEGIPVTALTPTTAERIMMAPIAFRITPYLRGRLYEPLNRFGYSWYRPVFQRKLRDLVKGADVVHALAGGYIGWAAEASAREHGVPFICTPFVHPKQWGDGANDVAYYNRADAVIGLVESDRNYLASLGVPDPKLRVIGVSPDLPGTSDPDGFRARHGLTEGQTVLFVGRMTAYKGAKSVLEAAKIVWQEKPDTHFVFIGPASDEERAPFENCDPRIQYLGKVGAEEKASALAACDIFCMPSVSEILPTVYLEAWSYGKPVIGGTAHGLAELVEGNGAGMIAKQDAGVVASALLVMLRDPALRAAMGDCGRRLVQDKYAVPAVTGALEDLYAEAISRRRAV